MSGRPVLKLKGGVSCCSVTQLRRELGLCPVLLPLLARAKAKPAAALQAGELPSPFLLECLLLLTHTSVGFTEPGKFPAYSKLNITALWH